MRTAVAVVLLAGLVLFGGVARADDPPELANARPLELGKETSFTLATLHERALFRVDAPASGVATLAFVKVPKAHDPVVRWLLRTGETVRDGETDVYVRKDAPAFLEVRSHRWPSEDQASAESLVIRVDFKPLAEPRHDTLETAETLAPGQLASFVFEPRLHHHFLRVVAPDDGVLNLVSVHVPTVHELACLWRDAKGAELRPWNERDVRLRKGDAAILELRSHFWGNHERASFEPVSVRVDFTALAEPRHDTLETAETVAPGQLASFVFEPRLHHHFLRVVAPDDGVLDLVSVHVPAVHELACLWHDAKGAELRPWNERDVRLRKGDAAILELRSHFWGNDERASFEPVSVRVDFRALAEPPHDTLETAETLAPGQLASFVFEPRLHHHFLRVVAPDDGVLNLVSVHVPTVHELACLWRDAKGAELRPWNERDVRLRKGDVAILELRSHFWGNDERASFDPVNVRVDFTALADPPHDTLETAETLAPGQLASFVFEPRLHRHFLRVVAPDDGVLTLVPVKVPAVHELATVWHDAKGAELRAWNERDVRLRKGDVAILELRSHFWGNDERASFDPVAVRVDLKRVADDDRGNHDLAHAIALAPGVETSVTFAVHRTAFFYAFDQDRDGLAALEILAKAEGHAPAVRWLDASGNVLRAGSSLWLARGRHFVELSNAFWPDDWTSLEPVRFRLVVTATPDPFKPNQTPDAAAPLELERRVRGELLAGKPDFFLFTPPSRGTFRVEATGAQVRVSWVGRGGGLLAEGADVKLDARIGAFVRVESTDASLASYDLRVVRVGGDSELEPGLYPRRPPPLAPAKSIFDDP